MPKGVCGALGGRAAGLSRARAALLGVLAAEGVGEGDTVSTERGAGRPGPTAPGAPEGLASPVPAMVPRATSLATRLCRGRNWLTAAACLELFSIPGRVTSKNSLMNGCSETAAMLGRPLGVLFSMEYVKSETCGQVQHIFSAKEGTRNGEDGACLPHSMGMGGQSSWQIRMTTECRF
jgi:hypothetical protein